MAKDAKVDVSKAKATAELVSIIDRQMSALGLTQQNVAEAVGFNNRNMLTIIKKGLGKLPIERVPAMAKCLKVDERHLMRLALLQSYSPEIVNMILGVTDYMVSANERAIIETIRSATNNSDPELTPDLTEKIQAIFA